MGVFLSILAIFFNPLSKLHLYNCHKYSFIVIFTPMKFILLYSINSQGSNGIRQWWVNGMFIPNDNTQKYTFFRYKITSWNVCSINFINQPTKIQWKSPKLLSQPIRKGYYTILGTSVLCLLPPLLSVILQTIFH